MIWGIRFTQPRADGAVHTGCRSSRAAQILPWLAALLILAHAASLCAEPSPLKASDLKVTDAQSWPQKSTTTGLGGSIEVTVKNLNDFLSQHTDKQPKDFVLYLDGRPIPALDVRRVSINGDDQDKLRYDLSSTRSDDAAKSSQPVWDKLLGSPSLCLDSKKTVDVTVGLGSQPIDSTATIRLTIVPKMWGGIGLVVVLIVTFGLVALVALSDVLKDPGLVTAADGTRRKPYSLSRVQLAIWFWAIFCAYVFIWVINGETVSLTGQVLGILGISSATLAGSAVMNSRNTGVQQTTLEVAAKALADKLKRLDEIAAAFPTANAEDQTSLALEKTNLDSAVARLKQQIYQICTWTKPTPGDPTSIPFLTDILSDGDGISLPRFQACAWTLVTVVIFLSTVWQTLSMPEFDGYMLSLMGLSSGTYVGMKATEKPQPQAPAA